MGRSRARPTSLRPVSTGSKSGSPRRLGGAVSDTPNVVTFDDDYQIHLSVAAFPLSRDLKAEFDTRGPKDFLINFFTVLSCLILSRTSRARAWSKPPPSYRQFQGGSILIFTLHPGGSNFERRSTIFRTVKPVVAKRGNLCFVRSGYVFIISTELAERALERSTYRRRRRRKTSSCASVCWISHRRCRLPHP